MSNMGNIMESKEFLKENLMENKIIISESDFKIKAVRSSGPGGQNVNKLATKVMLRCNVWNLSVLSQEQKQKIITAYPNWIDKKGNLIIYSQSERSQYQNKQEVIEKLHRMVNDALKPVKERIPTKIPRRAKEKRLKEKKKQTGKKRLRRKPQREDWG